MLKERREGDDQPLSSTRLNEPAAARSRRRAAPADTPSLAIAMASLALPDDAASRRAASRGPTPPSSATNRSARARSLAERGRRSTIRLPWTLPSRAKAPVVSVLSASFVAVPP